MKRCGHEAIRVLQVRLCVINKLQGKPIRARLVKRRMGRAQLAHASDEALQVLRVRHLPIGVALRLQARALRPRVRLHCAERERACRVLRSQRQLQALWARSTNFLRALTGEVPSIIPSPGGGRECRTRTGAQQWNRVLVLGRHAPGNILMLFHTARPKTQVQDRRIAWKQHVPRSNIQSPGARAARLRQAHRHCRDRPAGLMRRQQI